MQKTKVKFIKFQGDIIALFPECKNMHYPMIMSYAHNGQHSEASSSLMKLRYATPAEYLPLMKELERIGYDLQVMKGKK